MSAGEHRSSGRPANSTGFDHTPTLIVVSRPTFDRDSFDAFLSAQGLDWRASEDATSAENLVEIAGRLCYLSFGDRQSPKTNREYIRHLISHGHESVLEHAVWSFLLIGVSRGFSHQLVRHRVGFAFSQLSQQYHDERSADVRMPDVLRNLPLAGERWQAAVNDSQRAYAELLELLDDAPNDLPPRERLRLIRTAARSVLPAATETKLLFSANARALRHFLRTRGTVEGDEEMRLVAAAVLRSMKQEAPSMFADFRLESLSDGLPVVRHLPNDE